MKHVLKYTLFLLSLLCAACESQKKSDQPETVNGKWDVKEETVTFGPSTVVRTIKQDRKGNLWMTSWQGVFKYDGKVFTNITREVTSARFFSLLEDRNGNFWMGTIGSGVYFYDGNKFQNYTTRDGLISNEIGVIYEDRAGHIWFGGSGGISRFDGKGFLNFMVDGNGMTEDRTGKTFSQRQPYAVNSIIQDRTGKFWFATTSQTFVYDGKTFTVFSDHGKPFPNVGNIIEDKKGNVWLGGTRYDGTTFTYFSKRPVLYVYEDSHGNVWTTSANSKGGKDWVLSRYEATSLDSGQPVGTEIKPQLGALFTILEANDGSIWVGADGVYRYDGKTFKDFGDRKPTNSNSQG